MQKQQTKDKMRMMPLGGHRQTKCDICATNEMAVDGKTFMGCWAYMCDECHRKYGVGLGLGKGQKIDLQALMR